MTFKWKILQLNPRELGKSKPLVDGNGTHDPPYAWSSLQRVMGSIPIWGLDFSRFPVGSHVKSFLLLCIYHSNIRSLVTFKISFLFSFVINFHCITIMVKSILKHFHYRARQHQSFCPNNNYYLYNYLIIVIYNKQT